MLIRINDTTPVGVGGCIFYYNLEEECHSTGEVMVAGDQTYEVDFGDTLVEYLHSDISYVYNTQLGDEHHMSVKPGKIISDYRGLQ